MSKNDYTIRLEKADEHREVETLVREAFWNVYRPGCLEHYVLHCLRDDADFVPELDFVMELDGRLIGQDIFVRTAIHADDGRSVPIMTMGPICIAPEFQGNGYGKILLAAPKGDRLMARAVCRKNGRSSCVINVDVTDDLGRDVAQFVGTGFKL